MRLPPLPADRWDDAVQQALAVMLPEERRNPDDASNILSTFVRHPDLTKAFLRFNVHLLFHSTLPPRLRELAILRVAHRTSSDYEWAQHVKIGGVKDSPMRRSPACSAERPPTSTTASSSPGLTSCSTSSSYPMRHGRRLANGSTNGSEWTSSSRSAATSR